MVFNRKRKDNRSPSFILDDSPKRTKVQAQRKFAQGSNVNSPVLSPVKEIECQEKIIPEPIELLPMKRPNTEDFLTFLCFRGTPVLPPNLNFFNNASMVDTRPQSSESPSTSPKNGIIFPTTISKCQGERPFIAFGVRKRADPIVVSRHMDKKRRHALALQALRRKYQEQKMAKIRAITISKLSEKVQTNKTVVRTTRSVTKSDHTITKKNVGQKTKITVVSTKRVKVTTRRTSTLKPAVRSKGNKQKMCLRSYRGRFVQRELVNKPAKKRAVNKSSKSGDEDGSSAEEFSSDDDEPLLKRVEKKAPKKVKGVKKPSEITYRLTRSNQILARRHPTQSRIIVRTQSTVKTPPNSPRLRSQLKRKLKVVKQEVKTMPLKKHLVDMKRKALRGGRIREIDKRSCVKSNETAKNKKNDSQEEKTESEEKRITRDAQKKKTEDVAKTIKDKSKRQEEKPKAEEKKITTIGEPGNEKKQKAASTKNLVKKTAITKKPDCIEDQDTANKSSKKNSKPDDDAAKKNTTGKNKKIVAESKRKKMVNSKTPKEDKIQDESEEESGLARPRFPRKSKEDTKTKAETPSKNIDATEDEELEKKPTKSKEEIKTIQKTDAKISKKRSEEDPKMIKKNTGKDGKKHTEVDAKENAKEKIKSSKKEDNKTVKSQKVLKSSDKKRSKEESKICKESADELTTSKEPKPSSEKLKINKKSDRDDDGEEQLFSGRNDEELETDEELKTSEKNIEVKIVEKSNKNSTEELKIRRRSNRECKTRKEELKIDAKVNESSDEEIGEKNKIPGKTAEKMKKNDRPGEEPKKLGRLLQEDVNVPEELKKPDKPSEGTRKSARVVSADIEKSDGVSKEMKTSSKTCEQFRISGETNEELKIFNESREEINPSANVVHAERTNEVIKTSRRTREETSKEVTKSSREDGGDKEVSDGTSEETRISVRTRERKKKSTRVDREEVKVSGKTTNDVKISDKTREYTKISCKSSEEVKVGSKASDETKASCDQITISNETSKKTQISGRISEDLKKSVPAEERKKSDRVSEDIKVPARENNTCNKFNEEMTKSDRIGEEIKKSSRIAGEDVKTSDKIAGKITKMYQQQSHEEMMKSKPSTEPPDTADLEDFEVTTCTITAEILGAGVKISEELKKEEKTPKEILKDIVKISEELKKVGTVEEKTSNEMLGGKKITREIKDEQTIYGRTVHPTSKSKKEAICEENADNTMIKQRRERMKFGKPLIDDTNIDGNKSDSKITHATDADSKNILTISEEIITKGSEDLKTVKGLKITTKTNDGLNTTDINATANLQIESNDSKIEDTTYFNKFLFKDLSHDHVNDGKSTAVDETKSNEAMKNSKQFEELRKPEPKMKTYSNTRLRKTSDVGLKKGDAGKLKKETNAHDLKTPGVSVHIRPPLVKDMYRRENSIISFEENHAADMNDSVCDVTPSKDVACMKTRDVTLLKKDSCDAAYLVTRLIDSYVAKMDEPAYLKECDVADKNKVLDKDDLNKSDLLHIKIVNDSSLTEDDEVCEDINKKKVEITNWNEADVLNVKKGDVASDVINMKKDDVNPTYVDDANNDTGMKKYDVQNLTCLNLCDATNVDRNLKDVGDVTNTNKGDVIVINKFGDLTNLKKGDEQLMTARNNLQLKKHDLDGGLNQEDILKKVHDINFLTNTKKYYDNTPVEQTMSESNDSEVDDGTDSDEDTALKICENFDATDSEEDVPLRNYEAIHSQSKKNIEGSIFNNEEFHLQSKKKNGEENSPESKLSFNNEDIGLGFKIQGNVKDATSSSNNEKFEKNVTGNKKEENLVKNTNVVYKNEDFDKLLKNNSTGRKGMAMKIDQSMEKNVCDANLKINNEDLDIRWKNYMTSKKDVEREENADGDSNLKYEMHLKSMKGKNDADILIENIEERTDGDDLNREINFRLQTDANSKIEQHDYCNFSFDNEENSTNEELAKKIEDDTEKDFSTRSKKMEAAMMVKNIEEERIVHKNEAAMVVKQNEQHININDDEILKKIDVDILESNMAILSFAAEAYVKTWKDVDPLRMTADVVNDVANRTYHCTGVKYDDDNIRLKKKTGNSSSSIVAKMKGDIALSKYPDDDDVAISENLDDVRYDDVAKNIENTTGDNLLMKKSEVSVKKISDRDVALKKSALALISSSYGHLSNNIEKSVVVTNNSDEGVASDDVLIKIIGDGGFEDALTKNIAVTTEVGKKSEDCVEAKRPKYDEITPTKQKSKNKAESPEKKNIITINEIEASKQLQDIITEMARELAAQDAQFRPKQFEAKKKNSKKPTGSKKGAKLVETKECPKLPQRPSRKTKEAAAVYMEILGHKLGNEEGDDDVSIDSFPELPNVRKMEQRENELKAKALKENPPEEMKTKPVKKRERKIPKVAGSKSLRNFTSDSDESYTAEIKTPPEKRLRQTRNTSPKLYKSFSDTDSESDLIPIKQQVVVKRKSDTLSGDDKGKKKAKLVEEEESFDESDEEPLVKLKLKKKPEEGKLKRECTKKPQNYLPLFSSSDDEEKYFHGFVKCESPPKPQVLKIEPPIDLLSTKDVGRRYGKEKVNMSNEQIEKWLNDSALAGMSVIKKENDEMLKFGEKIPTETSLENLADINTDGLKSSLLKPVLKDKTVCSTSVSPEKYAAAMRPFSNERKTIFRKEKCEPSRNVNAFSVCNESSVYAFEADNEDSISTPFRRPNRRPSSTATSRSEDDLGRVDAEQKNTGKFRHPNVIRADCTKLSIKDASLNISTDESNNSGSITAQKTALMTTTKLPPEKPSKPLAASTPMCPPTQTTLQKSKMDNRSARSCSKSIDRISDASEEFKYKVPSSPSASSSSSAKLYKRNAKSRPKGSENYTPINVTEFPGISQTARIVEAPVFHPNEKEFIDPIEYIEKIREKAQKFGICRIVPPPNFKPECKVLDEMRFTAYNQYVHKMMHRWGPNFRELVAIRKYLATQSISLKHPPWIGGMEIDLPRLYQTVQTLGGLKEVIEKKKWPKVSELMKIPKSAQDRVTKLDDIYCKYLLPYDTLSPDERDKLFDSVETEWAKRESKNLLKAQQNADEETKSEDEEMESEDEEESDIECIVKGRSMALNTFYRIARNSMATWFKNPEPNAQEVEEEFWKHVTTKQYHICVHSGSIDSGNWGYGFAVSKNSPFARHAWNLKVLTNNSGSVLRSMGPVMGLTVPTLHVGMVFSGCCWYRDPHGLPWIEYLHTGANKIWYGIPDTMSEKFHSTLLNLVPNYCLNKSIWLPSDTVMLPPELLVDSGVSLTRTVQKPGQFVVIFPKAFTSNICTGYVVSESVFFAPPHWLDSAEYVFEELRNSCEPSMFSYERLLLSIANDSRSDVNVLKQIVPAVGKLCVREKKQREELKTLGVTGEERLPVPDNKKKKKMHECETEYACEDCRWNLFCSMVFDSQENGIYCLEHAINHLQAKILDSSKCRLMYTYDLAELDVLVKNLNIAIEMKLQKKSYSRQYSLPTMVHL